MDQKSCFKLKGSSFTLTVLQLQNNNLDCLKKELAIKVDMMPNFFNNTPIVIDLNELTTTDLEIDFTALKDIICSFRMIPVGVKGSIPEQKQPIEESGLAILSESKKTSRQEAPQVKGNNKAQDILIDKTLSEQKYQLKTKQEAIEESNQEANPDKIKQQTNKENPRTVLVKQTVRSGQQISSADGDLIIIGSVSAGAEILAAGNIHVYGTLRGRALAGIKGNKNACVFCHNLQAELISIAGIYLLSDDIPVKNMGAANHINLSEEKLVFNLI